MFLWNVYLSKCICLCDCLYFLGFPLRVYFFLFLLFYSGFSFYFALFAHLFYFLLSRVGKEAGKLVKIWKELEGKMWSEYITYKFIFSWKTKKNYGAFMRELVNQTEESKFCFAFYLNCYYHRLVGTHPLLLDKDLEFELHACFYHVPAGVHLIIYEFRNV